MKIEHQKWTTSELPKKVLFIRLQAMGDTIITLPYIRGFKMAYPDIEIHFLTRKEDSYIPSLFSDTFHKVWIIGGGRNPWLQLMSLFFLIPNLLQIRFQTIYDLQDNRISKILRSVLRCKGWSRFDKFSPNPAGIRTYNTIKAVGLSDFKPFFSQNAKAKQIGKSYLKSYNPQGKLFVINPAGFFESRNWPMDYYISWAKMILDHFNQSVTFMWIGIDRIAQKANEFEREFPDHTLNIVNKTTPIEAYGIIQNVDFILTEDSGLMHMAWTSGIPTLALFGSTRSDWSRPLGDHSRLLDSSDLPCGNCMLPICKYQDNRCLTRYTPKHVFEETLKLMGDNGK